MLGRGEFIMKKLLFLVFLASMSFGGTNWNFHFDMNKLLWGWGYSHLNCYHSHNTYGNQMTLEQMYYNSHHNQKSNKEIIQLYLNEYWKKL